MPAAAPSTIVMRARAFGIGPYAIAAPTAARPAPQLASAAPNVCSQLHTYSLLKFGERSRETNGLDFTTKRVKSQRWTSVRVTVADDLTSMDCLIFSLGWRRLKGRLCRVVTSAWLVIALAAMDRPPSFDHDRLAIEGSAGRFEFQVEVANTPDQRSYGLMFRESLADDRGMLFDFERPQPVTMWMRNTYIPLDMLFIRANGQIGRIVQEAEPLSDTALASGEPVRAVLELRGGVTAELGIEPGDRIVYRLFEGP
jgi:uncharacterized protein